MIIMAHAVLTVFAKNFKYALIVSIKNEVGL